MSTSVLVLGHSISGIVRPQQNDRYPAQSCHMQEEDLKLKTSSALIGRGLGTDFCQMRATPGNSSHFQIAHMSSFTDACSLHLQTDVSTVVQTYVLHKTNRRHHTFLSHRCSEYFQGHWNCKLHYSCPVCFHTMVNQA